ncbi:Aste57867_6073 [Aphanomyces stellatus]|uniref:Aste57867_6073 protein n=1 Tax=Aphanomyces stellatus TaxID=120398 RepID=A0A485KEC2_9STRA|nr:hypothetical protein As57867_006059 [Aphanomyces stellatus]VFT83084.1 Aste57867_6073 [Aphanomyces stellatus]
MTVDKTYNHMESSIEISPTYPRRVSLLEMSSVELAVVSLRVLEAYWAVQKPRQYCWVDLTHAFEIAHTAGRQQRCRDRFRTNGTVYLEAVLRNQPWGDFSQMYGGDDGTLQLPFNRG